MGNYKVVIFDLDGTLSDPREGVYNGIRHAVSILNFTIPEDFKFENFIGPPLYDSFQAMMGDDDKIVNSAVVHFR